MNENPSPDPISGSPIRLFAYTDNDQVKCVLNLCQMESLRITPGNVPVIEVCFPSGAKFTIPPKQLPEFLRILHFGQ